MPFAPRKDLIYLYERLDHDSKGARWDKATASAANELVKAAA